MAIKFLLEISACSIVQSGTTTFEFNDLPTATRVATKIAEILPDARIMVRDTNQRWYVQMYSWGPGTRG